MVVLCAARVSHCGGPSGCGARVPGGLRGYGPRAHLLRGTWDLPGPGIEPVLPEPQVDSEVLYRQESP